MCDSGDCCPDAAHASRDTSTPRFQWAGTYSATNRWSPALGGMARTTKVAGNTSYRFCGSDAIARSL